MLPQSKTYLEDAGYSPQAAAWLQIGLFLAGVFGIRILSKVIHNFIPSHVVDCDHKHDEETGKGEHEDMTERGRAELNGSSKVRISEPSTVEVDEDTPLLSRSSTATPTNPRTSAAPDGSISKASQTNSFVTVSDSRRPSIFPRALSRTLSKYVSSKKDRCDENGPCLGFSDPCGNHCFNVVQRRSNSTPNHNAILYGTPTWQRVSSDYRFTQTVPEENDTNQEPRSHSTHHERSRQASSGQELKLGPRSRSATHHYHHPEGDHDHEHHKPTREPSAHSHHHSVETDHHHHVPTNAFMAIGLQTSLAIALHKAPEGFITYATNHANPSLGFAVFMALFIHNITEGFAMSLPLYLALNSRLKAIIWSSVLGGVSQPLGAGVAALWFKLAKEGGRMGPNEAVYGCMFAITAGVMASVALSLFSESMQLSHNKNSCIGFAFLGMAILGMSYALTAK